jgi:hypothetical protein
MQQNCRTEHPRRRQSIWDPQGLDIPEWKLSPSLDFTRQLQLYDYRGFYF